MSSQTKANKSKRKQEKEKGVANQENQAEIKEMIEKFDKDYEKINLVQKEAHQIKIEELNKQLGQINFLRERVVSIIDQQKEPLSSENIKIKKNLQKRKTYRNQRESRPDWDSTTSDMNRYKYSDLELWKKKKARELGKLASKGYFPIFNETKDSDKNKIENSNANGSLENIIQSDSNKNPNKIFTELNKYLWIWNDGEKIDQIRSSASEDNSKPVIKNDKNNNSFQPEFKEPEDEKKTTENVDEKKRTILLLGALRMIKMSEKFESNKDKKDPKSANNKNSAATDSEIESIQNLVKWSRSKKILNKDYQNELEKAVFIEANDNDNSKLE